MILSLGQPSPREYTHYAVFPINKQSSSSRSKFKWEDFSNRAANPLQHARELASTIPNKNDLQPGDARNDLMKKRRGHSREIGENMSIKMTMNENPVNLKPNPPTNEHASSSAAPNISKKRKMELRTQARGLVRRPLFCTAGLRGGESHLYDKSMKIILEGLYGRVWRVREPFLG